VIRALIVDDEAPARDRLRLLLGEAGDVEIVGEAEDGERAAEQIAALAPTVVFLDIQMPGCSGLELAASLAASGPLVVFCTAFDSYAVDAFELNAVDYLLKPVTRARLSKALDRLRRGDVAPDAVTRAIRATQRATRFLARKGATYRVVHAREVLCFLSEGGLTKLQTADGHYWLPPTLNELEERLDSRQFFRVSRAAIVNLDAVREVVPTTGGQGEAALRDGTRLEISRRRFKDLTDRLSG
jgi:two-component system, LytTR family, response regulator